MTYESSLKIEIDQVYTHVSLYTQDALKLIGVHGWLDSEGFGDRFFELVCEQTYIQAQSCRNWFRSVVGPSENLDPVSYSIFVANKKQNIARLFSQAMIPLFNVNFLRGTSVSVIAQFAQNYNAGEKWHK